MWTTSINGFVNLLKNRFYLNVNIWLCFANIKILNLTNSIDLRWAAFWVTSCLALSFFSSPFGGHSRYFEDTLKCISKTNSKAAKNNVRVVDQNSPNIETFRRSCGDERSATMSSDGPSKAGWSWWQSRWAWSENSSPDSTPTESSSCTTDRLEFQKVFHIVYFLDF